jgi:cytoskeletal protein CcmA (bactofilin family)
MVSIIASDLNVEGTLSSIGTIRVEGTVVGTVRAEHQVLVAKGGIVEGDIFTQEVILGGEVKGSIYADGRAVVEATAVIHGTIKAPCLAVDEGAKIYGQIQMARSKGTGDPGSDG